MATRTRYADGDAHWRNRLRQGMEHNIGLVIAKAVFGLIGEGIDPRILVREAVLFGTRHRDGWGAGVTVLSALGNLLHLLPNDDLCLALFQGIRRVASDCDGAVPPRPRQALSGDGRAASTLERWLRDWVLVRHRDGAERTLLTAIAGGASAVQMAELMFVAATERVFADGGHLLDFVNKAFEVLDLIGWEDAAAVLPAVGGELVQARGAEESDAWRHPIDLVSLLRAAIEELPSLLAEGAWGPLAGPRRPSAAASGRASGRDRRRAQVRRSSRRRADRSLPRPRLCRGAAGRPLRHRQRALGLGLRPPRVHLLQRSSRDAGTRVRWGRSEREVRIDPRWLRGVFYGAMSVYLDRFLDVPPAAHPGERGDTLDDLPGDADAGGRRGAVRGRLVAAQAGWQPAHAVQPGGRPARKSGTCPPWWRERRRAGRRRCSCLHLNSGLERMMALQKITPCLWFDSQAEEMARFLCLRLQERPDRQDQPLRRGFGSWAVRYGPVASASSITAATT